MVEYYFMFNCYPCDVLTSCMLVISHIPYIEDCSKLSIVQEIGRGSFGVVYLAKWRGTIVAAKQILIPPGQCAEALKEVQTLRYVKICFVLPLVLCMLPSFLNYTGKFSTRTSCPSWASKQKRTRCPSLPTLFKVPICTC